MRNIIVLSFEELHKLALGIVVECECQGVKTQLVCNDNLEKALALINKQEKAEGE